MRNLFLPPNVWLMCVLLMLALHSRLPGPDLPVASAALCTLGILLLSGGLAISALHARLFRQLETNIHTFRAPDRLVRERLYRFSRNPMYLGFVLGLVGLALALGASTPWLVVLGFVLLVDRWYIPFEERALEARFGADYAAYRRQVRRWI